MKKKIKLKAKQTVVKVKPTKKHLFMDESVYEELSKAMQASEIVGRDKKAKPKGKIVKIESFDWFLIKEDKVTRELKKSNRALYGKED